MALSATEKLEFKRLNDAVVNIAVQYVELRGMVEGKLGVKPLLFTSKTN